MPALTEIVDEVLADAGVRAQRPVTVPWRAPVVGFLAGFLATVLPAAIGTRLLGSQLPFAVLHGVAGLVFAFLTAAGAGLAVAVCAAARAMHR